MSTYDERIALDHEVFGPSLDKSVPTDELFRQLAPFDPFFREIDGRVNIVGAKVRSFPNEVALPICGPGYPNFGHFLYDGLPFALMLGMLSRLRVKLIGSPARPWQREIILARLGLLENFEELVEPTQFRGLIARSGLYDHLAYPTNFLRVIFDILIFTVGAQMHSELTEVYISLSGDKSGLSSIGARLRMPWLGVAS